MAAATLSVRPNSLSPNYPFPRPPSAAATSCITTQIKYSKHEPWRLTILPSRRYLSGKAARASSRADDSAPFEMSVENALKLLGVSEGASFDDILRAKKSVLASCKDDEEAISQVRFGAIFFYFLVPDCFHFLILYPS